jgi:hypothetical protein
MSMRTRLAKVLLLALTAGALAAPAAEASRPIETTVSGRVTDVRGGDTIVVDGRSFRVLPGSPAARTLAQIHAGQVVELVLSGEPGKDATRVTVISTREQP